MKGRVLVVLVLIYWLYGIRCIGGEIVLQVNGTIEREVFDWQHASDTVIGRQTGAFNAIFQDCSWNIKSTRSDDPFAYTESGATNSECIYTVFRLKDDPIKQGAVSNRQVAIGSVDSCFTSIADDSTFNAAILLTYGAKCYFSQARDGKIEPLWFTRPSRALLYKHIKLPFLIDWLDQSKQFPKQISFLDDGFERWFEDVHSAYFQDNKSSKWEGGFSAGFTNCYFEVTLTTNLNGCVLPQLAKLTRFGPVNSKKLAMVERFTITATEIVVGINSPPAWIPLLPGFTHVADHRFYGGDIIIPTIGYNVTNRWLSKLEVMALPEYAAMKESSIQKQRAATPKAINQPEIAKRKNIVVGILLIFMFGGAFVLINQFWKNKR